VEGSAKLLFERNNINPDDLLSAYTLSETHINNTFNFDTDQKS
jgi:hypothetical protein